MFYLKDKVAIITGGASGIGLAIAKLFANRGARTIVLDFDSNNGNKAVNDIRDSGGNAEFFQTDVSSSTSVNDTFLRIKDSKIDILVNNAGIAHVGNLENTTESDLDKLYQVNVKGVFHCSKAAIQKMKMGGGTILNIASVASLVGIKDRFGYSMTKGAVLAMTYTIAKDYIDHNIRCNAVAPGRIHTPFVDGFIAKNYPGKEKEIFEELSKTQPIGRMGTPEEVANLALYLCSSEAAFITGSCYNIDGGFVTLNT